MKAKSIAESGLFIALTIIILYSAAFISINTLTILTIASCIIPISIIRNNIKYSIFVYAASSILSLLLVPIKISLCYILFFGIYGIIKAYIEKINKLIIEIPLKLLCFNSLFIISFIFFKSIFIDISSVSIPILGILGAEVAFLIYDYALTLIISYYLKKFHKTLNH